MAPNADLRPFHTAPARPRPRRPAPSGRRGPRPIAATRSTASATTAVRESVDLDDQDGGGVDREAGVDEVLDRPVIEGVHHLDRRRHAAGRDDRRCTVAAPSSTRRSRAASCAPTGGFGREAHGDLGGDAERALAADERAAQVEPDGLGLEAAEHRDLAVGQHDLDRQDVRARDAVGEAMRPPGVGGHVAADRARLLARRIGREVQPVTGDAPCVRSRLRTPGSTQATRASTSTDEDAVHLRRDDHDRVAERHRAPGEPGARRRGPRTAGRGGRAARTQACTSSVVDREAHDGRRRAASARSASRPYSAELERLGAHLVGSQGGPKLLGEGRDHGLVPGTPWLVHGRASVLPRLDRSGARGGRPCPTGATGGPARVGVVRRSRRGPHLGLRRHLPH